MVRSRTRRVVKWVGTVVCALIGFAFVFSTRRALMWDSPELRQEIHLALGAISYAWRPEAWRLEDQRYPPRPGWRVAKYVGHPPRCWWIASSAYKSWQSVSVPLWMPFVVLAVPTVVVWYQDRRNIRATIRRL